MKKMRFSLMSLIPLGIFLFLSGCTKENTPPEARFSITPATGNTDTLFAFDASDCRDAEDVASVLRVRWDWTNDGIWDTDYSSNKTISHQYDVAGEYTVVLEVRDTRGLRNAMSKIVLVTESGTGSFTDPRDGRNYDWVRIGSQVWMSENLAYLPSVYPSSSEYQTSPIFNVYGYEGTIVAEAKTNPNYTTYGVLYDWPAAMTSCPEGWRLPDESEWTALLDYLGSPAGGKMKETGLDHWSSPNAGATNSFGFNGLPAGGRKNQGGVATLGKSVTFWSSTEDRDQYSWVWRLSYDNDNASKLEGFRRMGFSVRCIKN